MGMIRRGLSEAFSAGGRGRRRTVGLALGFLAIVAAVGLIAQAVSAFAAGSSAARPPAASTSPRRLGTGIVPTATLVTGAQAASKTTVSASPGTAYVGARVRMSAVVTSSGATPTGTVRFVARHATLCVVRLSRGSAHCYARFSAAGSYAVTGRYSGDFGHAASHAGARVVVRRAGTTTAIRVSTASPYPGQPVMLAATVKSPAGAPAATGTVRFSDTAGILCSATLTAARASCSYAWTTAGTFTVAATYAGNSAHAGSTVTASVIVAQIDTTTAITNPDPTILAAGTPFVIDVAVTADAPPGAPAPAGTVAVAAVYPPVDAGAPAYSCTVTLTDGAGSCEVTPSVGSYGILEFEGTYSGDTVYVSSMSSGEHQLINPETTSTTAGPTAALDAPPVVLTATVVNQAGTDILADGSDTPDTVAFIVDGSVVPGCSAVPLSYTSGVNIATCTDPLQGGLGGGRLYTVEAEYSGDEYNEPSQGTVTLGVGDGG